MEKEFDFNSIGKRTPYRTPEGFFERMQAETMKRVAEEKRRKKLYRLKWGVSVALAAAAMICGFLFLPFTQKDTVEPAYPTEWVAQLSGGMDAMDVYLQGLSDEELEEWVEFSENDIYYELTTTENLNEDED
ncbi:MAG: hypothetical protein IJX29_08625 [Bacteroides sp.]|nr:hypothetical protein [Bacteroides sp.]